MERGSWAAPIGSYCGLLSHKQSMERRPMAVISLSLSLSLSLSPHQNCKSGHPEEGDDYGRDDNGYGPAGNTASL